MCIWRKRYTKIREFYKFINALISIRKPTLFRSNSLFEYIVLRLSQFPTRCAVKSYIVSKILASRVISYFWDTLYMVATFEREESDRSSTEWFEKLLCRTNTHSEDCEKSVRLGIAVKA